jgi:peptidoglycan/LPS O-acetylase OafA/YrhL
VTPQDLQFSPFIAAGYACAIYLFMFGVAWSVTRIGLVGRDVIPTQGRYGSLDGLRGVLAVGVLVHHSFTSYVYFLTGNWTWSSSTILNHLGQTTVAMFFMITGFLFTLKAMSMRIDWKRLYASRVARLFPLYALIVCVVFVLALSRSSAGHWERPLLIASEFLQWISFVCFGRPDINGYPMSWTLIAGVNWSLKFEVIFYLFAVPLLHAASRLMASRKLLRVALAILGALLVVRLLWLNTHGGSLLYATHFLCGIVTAYAYADPQVRRFMQSRPFRVAAGILAFSLFFLSNANGSASIAVTLVLFMAVVGGSSIGGLLNTRPALWLGDISYGIYLIHGLILWLVLSALRSHGLLQPLDFGRFALLMLGVGLIVVLLATTTYVRLERPIMDLFKRGHEGIPRNAGRTSQRLA